MVIIDRAGVIRAQSGVRPGDPKLEDENALRALIDGLLKEKPPTATDGCKANSIAFRTEFIAG